MEVYRSLEEIHSSGNAWVTLGIFDGVHVGHQKIIQKLVSQAKAHHGKSWLITFDPHPQEFFLKKKKINLLTLLEEKLELLEQLGLDAVVVVPFTPEFAKIEPHVFVEQWLLQQIGMRGLIVGENYIFGKNRTGNVALLQKLSLRLNFSLQIQPLHFENGDPVSSTRIRNLLLAGDVLQATRLLGRPYALQGKVVPGEGVGRQLGFPTVNLSLPDSRKLVPQNGIYAVFVYVQGKKYEGTADIGFRPTLGGTQHRIEAYIHHFNEEIYGEMVKLEFIERIRDEKQFDDLNALVVQIREDTERSAELLSQLTNT